MKKLIFLLSALYLHISISAQDDPYVISGKVIDAASNAALPSASVFAQNTTIGTSTDSAGNFKLILPGGGYNLVISFIGYQTVTFRVTASDANDKKFIIALRLKEKSLEDIVIASNNEVKDGWEKYGSFFLQNFVGQTDNSDSCILINKEVLHFYFSKKRNILKILADTPLIILNKALGYTIKYTLDSFVYNYNMQMTSFKGYPLFVTMYSPDSAQETKWTAARLKAYHGSILHFMRSYYKKDLKKDGFAINFLMKVDGKENLVPILNFYDAMNYYKDDSTKMVTLLPSKDEVAIVYSKAKPGDRYITASPSSSKKQQISILSFEPLQAITVEVNGYYFDQTTIIKSGYFSWLRMADTLPYDFKSK